MTTFEEAQDIVVEQINDRYLPEDEFQLAPWGWETDEWWIVSAGSRVSLYGAQTPEDRDLIRDDDAPITVVNKLTGEYVEHYTYGEDPFPDRTPIGEPPEE